MRTKKLNSRSYLYLVLNIIIPIQAVVAENDTQTSPTGYERIVSSIAYADLSRAAYGGISPPDKFSEIDRQKGKMGFEAAAFKSGPEIVIAFAGTNPKQLGDLATDAHAFIPMATPDQFKQAMDYVQKIKSENPGSQIRLTGHSLGGQLALYTGGIYHLDAIAFNAPPPNLKMRREISEVQQNPPSSDAKPIALSFVAREGYQSHYGLTADLVSAEDLGIRGSYGTLVQVPVHRYGAASRWNPKQHVQSFLAYHDLEEMVNSMRTIRDNGSEDYERISKVWEEIDQLKKRPSDNALPGIDFENKTTTGGGSPPMDLPGIDFEKGTTTGGGAPPMELPGIEFEKGTTTGGGAPPFELPGFDFERGTTTGGGGPPIPIPQIPKLPEQ